MAARFKAASLFPALQSMFAKRISVFMYSICPPVYSRPFLPSTREAGLGGVGNDMAFHCSASCFRSSVHVAAADGRVPTRRAATPISADAQTIDLRSGVRAVHRQVP